MRHIANPMRQSAIAGTPLAAGERWLVGIVVIMLAAIALVLARGFGDEDVARLLRDAATSSRPAASLFSVDAELAVLEARASDMVVDLAADAVLVPAERFQAASGPPRNLLAQVEAPRRAPPPVELAMAVPVDRASVAARPPGLSAEEQLVVDANGERRAVRLAYADVVRRAVESGVGAALAVQPLLWRAEAAVAELDAFGDALLLASGAAEHQLAYAGFEARRVAALADIERAADMLGTV